MKVKRLIEEWGMDKLRRLCVSKSITGDRDKDLSRREGFGDWLRGIRRARGKI